LSGTRSPLRVLVVHNRYRQRGGEDVVFERETQLLRDAGHEVATYERHNDEIDEIGAASLAAQTIWSRRTVDEVQALVRRFEPDVAHVHNTFPLISPSVYPTLKQAGVPIVQTLHNYRMTCLNAMLLREGKPCEDCVGRLPWRGVVHKCYRGSAAQSAVLGAALSLHRSRSISENVDKFIALTQFARALFIRAGVPAHKLVVKPNFVADGGHPPFDARADLLYVGRLSEEKGISILAAAMRLTPQTRLDVIGDGPCAHLLAGMANVRLLGRQESAEVRRAMTASSFLILPSVCYEGFPMTIVEAYEAGLPVIASDIGALREIVNDGVTGYRARAGDANDLAKCIASATRLSASETLLLREGARQCYELLYSPSANASSLKAVYQAILHNSREAEHSRQHP
jgi:glycosyltransferase involved in cell wall biosynthesis